MNSQWPCSIAFAGHDIAVVSHDCCADGTAGPSTKAVLELACLGSNCRFPCPMTRTESERDNVAAPARLMHVMACILCSDSITCTDSWEDFSRVSLTHIISERGNGPTGDIIWVKLTSESSSQLSVHVTESPQSMQVMTRIKQPDCLAQTLYGSLDTDICSLSLSTQIPI